MNWHNSLLIISFISFLMTIWSYYCYRKAKNSSRWNKIVGEITASSLDVSYQGSEGSGTYVYTPLIKYKYTIDNRNYSSERISYAYEGLIDQKKAYRLINKYSPGAKQIIYYNPKDPSDSVLFNGTRPYNYLNIFGYLMLSLITFSMSYGADIN